MAYEPTAYQIARDRIARAYRAIRGRDSNRADSVASGYLLDPTTDKYNRRWNEPLEHDLLVEELQQIIEDHPVVEAALRKITEGIGEFSLSVKSAVGGDVEAGRANRILQRTKNNCQIEKELPEIAYTLISLGENFIQVCLDKLTNREISDILLMPNTGFIRNTNILDQFKPGEAQFIQRTPALNIETPFYEGQILHPRFNHRRGQRNGNSILFAGRAMCKDSIAALRSMLPRRLANQPFRHFNVSPGKGIVFTLFAKIKDSLSRLVHIIKGGQVTPWDDVFTNNVDVKVLGGADSTVGDLKDIELQIDSVLMLLGVSRQILGAGTNVNRDVMDEQRDEMHATRRRIVKVLKVEFLKPLFDLALSLQGIPPANIDYTIDFADQFSDSRIERRIENSRDDYQAGVLSLKSVLSLRQTYYQIEDPEAEIAQIMRERAAGLVPLFRGKPEGDTSQPGETPQPTQPPAKKPALPPAAQKQLPAKASGGNDSQLIN